MCFKTNSENNEIIFQDKLNKKYETMTKPIKGIKNHETENIKRDIIYHNHREINDFYSKKSNGIPEKNGRKINYISYNKSAYDENLSDIEKINLKNHKSFIINKAYKIPNNDKIRINTYLSEKLDKDKKRTISSNRINKNFENTLSKYKLNESNGIIKNNEEKNKNLKNLYFINSNKNTSIKIINIAKNNFSSPNTIDKKSKQLLIKSEKTKNKKEIFDNNNKSLDNNYYYNNPKNNNKCLNTINNELIQMTNFEFYYESEKGERNSYNKIKNDIIKNNNANNYNDNFFNSNINLKEESKNNYFEDYENKNIYTLSEYNNKCYINNQNNYQKKYHINQKKSSINNTLNDKNKKGININDSVEFKDLNNFKSLSVINCVNQNNSRSNTINSKTFRQNKSKVLNNKQSKKIIPNHNLKETNKSIDINILNGNNIISPNISVRNSINMNIPININQRNPNNIKRNNNSINNPSKIKKKNENNLKAKINFKKYNRQSDIKKIILIQSVFKAYFLRLKLSNTLKVYYYLQKLLENLFIILYIRKVNYWKIFLNNIFNKIIQKNKNKKFSSKISKNKNALNKNNKLILKSNEINNLQKELGDSFNIINNNNDLKSKLEDMIKENNQLKNQLFDIKNIEDKLNQLIIENKKNQNINEIIVKDNQQLAKKLKDMQNNKNNKFVIQNQKSFLLNMEQNLQFSYISKLKNLNLKYLILKKLLKNKNKMKMYFNKYRNNVKRFKDFTIENSNIFINNRRKINMQIMKNYNINYISQNYNNKNSVLYKLFIKREKENNKLVFKFFNKLFYLSKFDKLDEPKEKNKNEKEKEKLNKEKKIKLQSIIDKYERNYKIICKNVCKQWRLRSVIFKIKGVAKEIKRKKKLKKKIRDKKAKECLNYLKNKSPLLQTAHELSYNIEQKEESELTKNNKCLTIEENLIKDGNDITEKEKEKDIKEPDDSGDSIGTGD